MDQTPSGTPQLQHERFRAGGDYPEGEVIVVSEDLNRMADRGKMESSRSRRSAFR